ncbi:acyltransferase [Peribacillus frigoritolerans]|uniref:acyltransferase n=1 Tax=Peribacillus frigoritolerans TaxID=450367 RepID=UPI0030160CE8
MSVYDRVKNKINWMKYNKERKMLKAMDKNLHIYGEVIIKDPNKIEIGYNCRLNDYAFLHGGGGLRIEDDVTVSAFAKIISWGYNTENWPNNFIVKDHVGGLIHLGKGTWVGAGATILPGVKLTGTGIIVAAGSVVTKSFDEDFILIGGSPARVLKRYKAAQ